MLVTGVFDADAAVLTPSGHEERPPLDRIGPNDEFRSVTVIQVKYL